MKINSLTKEYFQAEIKKHEDEIKRIQNIIKWMDETHRDTISDEQEYKIWEVLTIFEDDTMSKLEKVKLLTNILSK